MASLTQLVLAGVGRLAEDATIVQVCFSPNGSCLPSEYRVAECYRYDDLEVRINGVALPQVRTGGWSPIQRFEPLPEGGNGYGCNFPEFETDDLGVDALPRTTEISMRLGEDTLTVTAVDWLVDRVISVPETLVKGTEVLVSVEPPVSRAIQVGSDPVRRPTSYFIYEENGSDSERIFFDTIDPDSWVEGGYLFSVPEAIPSGAGRYRFNEAFVPAEIQGCPFLACSVNVYRTADALGVTIVEP